MLKNGWDLLKSLMIWWIEQIDWFFHGNNDYIIFGLAISLLCIIDICWASTAIVLV